MSDDLFKESFKKYRKILDSHIFDIENLTSVNTENVNKIEIESKCHCTPPFGLISPHEWIVYNFSFPAGLIFIKNPFTPEGQQYWISQCLTDYPSPPHITNILNLNTKLKNSIISSIDFNNDNAKIAENEDFFRKLRWITFGYHHNWDTKVYEERNKCDFPPDLKELTKYMAIVLGFKDFAAEAAIVNYYHLDSTLSGHVDKSEENKEAPLFSISFGQTAIFLIGGSEKSITPLSLYLRSGDVVIMAGKSRASYHAVPRIVKTEDKPWNDLEITKSISCKKTKIDPTTDCDCPASLSNFNFTSFQQVISKWSSFSQRYISESRINLNVRQVLLPGTSKLQKN